MKSTVLDKPPAAEASRAALKARLAALSPEQRQKLLAVIAGRRAAGADPLSTPLPGPQGCYALSSAQRRFWLASQIGEADLAAYNIAAAFYFDDTLDALRLESAWRVLLRRHPVLTSRFHPASATPDGELTEDPEGDSIAQTPREAEDWSLDLNELGDDGEFKSQVEERAARLASQPLDLAHDFPVRVELLRSRTRGASGLIIVIHHAVCDGLSIPILTRELAALYEDAGAALPTPPQYRDEIFAEAQRSHARALDYWRPLFADHPEPLPLATDFPRPAQRSLAGASIRVAIEAPRVRAFERLCGEVGASFSMGYVALSQLLLARAANHEDIVIGTPVAGRLDARAAAIVGPFVNTVVLRSGVAPSSSFRELLLGARDTLLGALSHQELPFDSLVQSLGLKPDPSRAPLFDVMIGINEAESGGLTLGASEGVALDVETRASKVDLTFHVERQQDGALILEIEYATALFERGRIESLGQAWRSLLESVARVGVDVRLSELALLDSSGRDAILDAPQPPSWLSTGSIVERFATIARQTPDAPAVQSETRVLNYGELDRLSDLLADWLIAEQAVKAEEAVALMLEKSELMIVALLGVLKAGGAYLPLTLDTPPERAEFVLADAAACVVLTQGEHAGTAGASPAQRVDLVALLERLSLRAPQRPCARPTLRGDALAYIIYTSGSTGRPKGTLIEHGSVLRLVLETDFHQVRPGERVLQTGSLAFDASTFEIWGPLLNGGCCCIPAGSSLLEIADFGSLVARFGIDTAFMTTGLFNQLVEYNVEAFAELDTVLTGGEKVSVKHVNKLLDACPELALLHVYGPTENTTFSSWHRIEGPQIGTVPIGRAIAHSSLFVLDRERRPLPSGFPGEIVCGGAGLARGYLGREELDREVFVTLPGPEQPLRLYRTGDIGMWNSRGELVFLGRNDNQVKVRGFRVELGEVEASLRALDGIKDAVVVARATGVTNELLAYVVIDQGRAETEAGIRERLQPRVPNYMVPARLVLLDALPLNASGKVDTRRLPEPREQEHEPASADQAAEESSLDAKQQTLLKLARSILGIEGVKLSENFFALGGDSIKAIQLVAQARQRGYRFALADLFATQSFSGLCALIDDEAAGQRQALLSSAVLSPIQRWWLAQAETPRDRFCLSSVLLSRSPLEQQRLRQGVAALVDLHPALRLTLDVPEGVQRIAAAGSFHFAVLDQRAGEDEAELAAFWDSLQGAISLSATRLIAVGLVQREGQSLVGLVVHHLAADEITGRLLVSNLERLYRSECDAESLTTLREGLAVTNWAAGLQSVTRSGHFDAQRPYWQDVAGRVRSSTQARLLDSGSSSGPESVKRVALEHRLEASQSEELIRLVKSTLRLEPQALLAAAFARAWGALSEQKECVLAMESHGREELAQLKGMEATAGWFTALYPVVLAADGELLDAVLENKDRLIRVPNRGIGYGALRYLDDREADAEACLESAPTISFNYLGAAAQGGGDSQFEILPESAGSNNCERAAAPFVIDALCSQSLDAQARPVIVLALQGGEAFAVADASCSLADLLRHWRAALEDLCRALRTARPRLSLGDCSAATGLAGNAELAALLERQGLDADAVATVLPVTALQAGLFFHGAESRAAYSDQVCLRIDRSLDPLILAEAYTRLVAEHEALRARFALSEGGAVLQLILKPSALGSDAAAGFNFVDGSAYREEESQQSQAEAVREANRARGFDLARETPFRLTLIQLPGSRSELIIDFHHIAIDGWSSGLLLQRLQALYDDRSAPAATQPPLSSYYDWMATSDASAAVAYWGELVGDYRHRLEIPCDAPRVEDASSTLSPLFQELRIGAATMESLTRWCGESGVTLSSALQTCWGLVLAQKTGARDVVFGATVSGREADVSGLQSLVGMFINTLPVRIAFDAELTLREIALRTTQQFARSIDHGAVPLAEIQALSAAGAGLLTHTLVFENYPANDSANGDEWHWETVDIYDPMHFGLGLIVAPVDGEMRVRFVADGARYSLGALAELGALLEAALTLLGNGADWSDAIEFASPWSVSANFTADPLEESLSGWEFLTGRSRAVHLLAYDQVVQELMSPASQLRLLGAPSHIILWRPRPEQDPAQRRDALDFLATAVRGYKQATPRAHVTLVQCPCSDESANAVALATLAELASTLDGVEAINASELERAYRLESWRSEEDQILGDLPYTEEFFAALAADLCRRRDRRERPPVKVIAVDADETLWGGIVGEDGPDGLQCGDVYRQLQEELVRLRDAGYLLCLVTKNNEADAAAAFERNDMPLSLEDFTRVCASWGPKSNSIRELAEDLSLGLDSFLFLDDSPVECDEVRSSCPEVLSILLPAAEERKAFLEHLWPLDSGVSTAEDLLRAKSYRDELKRREAAQGASDFTDFLSQLAVEVDLAPMDDADVPRVAQLTQRTNQFNTTTLRLSEAEVQAFAAAPDREIRRVIVADRFGDYGLTGALLLTRTQQFWRIDGFLLSCRVLGRGVEHRILTAIAQEMNADGVPELRIAFAASNRNQPARLFLDSLASREDAADASVYRLDPNASEQWLVGAAESATAESAAAAKTETTASATKSARLPRWPLYQRAAQLCTGGELLAAGRAILGSAPRSRAHVGPRRAPSTASELLLAELWCELLAESQFDVRDEFYALGGHSLKAVMLLSRLRIRSGIALDLQDLQESPSLEALAVRIDALRSERGVEVLLPPLAPAPRAADYPTAPGQARLWMLESMRGAGPSPFHMQAAILFDGTCDRPALGGALAALLARHPALRTALIEGDDGAPRQRVLNASALALACEWESQPLSEAAFRARGSSFSQRPFDLAKPPLIRVLGAELESATAEPAGFGLVITMHHSVSDGWSIGILARDLGAEYTARVSRPSPDDTDPGATLDDADASADALDYKDYAVWLTACLASESGARSSDFWRRHFAEPVEPLQLPTDRPRPTVKGSAGATLKFDIPAASYAAFTDALRAHSLSEFGALFAALQLVLARFSGQTNFSIGTPVAGRNHPALEEMVGFFVNVIPLRSSVDLALTTGDFLAAVSQELADCLSHQSFPFDAIIEGLDLPRDLSRSPLFDILLVLQNATDGEIVFGDGAERREGKVLRLESEASQYDLTLNAFQLEDGGLKLVVDYDTALFEAPRIERIARSLARVIASLPSKMRSTVAAVEWVPETDSQWQAAQAGVSVSKSQETLVGAFSAQVDTAAGLLIDAEQEWSYARLAAEADRVAGALAGVARGEVVGVLGARSCRSVAALLGVMKANAIYLPLDSANPKERLLSIVEDSAVDCLVVTDEACFELAESLRERGGVSRLVDYAASDTGTSLASLTQESTCSLARAAKPPPTPDDVAYMIYTSGSTGKPKGVRVSHGAFMTMIRAQVEAFTVTSQDVCGQFATLAFDASLSELFLALTTGASLALAPESARSDVDEFLAWLVARRVSVLTLPPAFLRALDHAQLGELRVLVTAGEAADASDLLHYAQSLTVINAYGPTETSVCATSYRVEPNATWEFGVPIGRPIDGALVTLRDAAGLEVATGVIGELFIGGAFLAEGYHGREDLSAERFIDGLPGAEGIRWYRTGDRCRWREDGHLEFLGRNDAQLKLRGFRVEIGEIEHALRELEGIVDASVVYDADLGLIAYVAAADEAGPAQLSAALAKTLPSYMLPSRFVSLAALPRTPAGKIDRAKLPAPSLPGVAAFTAPEGDDERTLAALWEGVLGKECVGRDDDFFALGGDSIKALRVISELRRRGLQLTLKSLFANPTLAGAARALEASAADSIAGADDAPPTSLSGAVPLLPTQRWFLNRQAAGARGHFNIAVELTSSAAIDRERLSLALQQLLAKHASLRARFVREGDEWRQLIRPAAECALELIEADPNSQVGATLVSKPFAIESELLIRCAVESGAEGEAVVLCLHHLIADWVSVRLLVEDLNAAYQGRALTADGDLLRRQALIRGEPLNLLERAALSHRIAKAFDLLEQRGLVAGDHACVETRHLELNAAQTTRLVAALGAVKIHEFLLQHATDELCRLLDLDSLPVLIEDHGRGEATQDLALDRLVAWLTQAKLALLRRQPSHAEGYEDARRQLARLRVSKDDVFPLLAEARPALPAVLSFNYLGEFNDASSDAPADGSFALTPRVFEGAVAAEGQADVPIHLEIYIVNGALEVQIAWSPSAFGVLEVEGVWSALVDRIRSAARADFELGRGKQQ